MLTKCFSLSISPLFAEKEIKQKAKNNGQSASLEFIEDFQFSWEKEKIELQELKQMCPILKYNFDIFYEFKSFDWCALIMSGSVGYFISISDFQPG